jgi:hypothetical protein
MSLVPSAATLVGMPDCASSADSTPAITERSRTQDSHRDKGDHSFRSPVPGRAHTPYQQDGGPLDLNEPGNLPPNMSVLYNTSMQMLTDVIAEELIPDEWISDVWAFAKAPPDIRLAVLFTLGFPVRTSPSIHRD